MCQQLKQPTPPHKQPSFLSVQKNGPIPKKPASKAVLAHKIRAVRGHASIPRPDCELRV